MNICLHMHKRRRSARAHRDCAVGSTTLVSDRTSVYADARRACSILFCLRANNIHRSEVIRDRLVGQRVLVAEARKMIADGTLLIHCASLRDNWVTHHSVQYGAHQVIWRLQHVVMCVCECVCRSHANVL
jgi:hypothetical protein